MNVDSALPVFVVLKKRGIFVQTKPFSTMKKVLLTAAVLFIATASFAQFSGGIKAGANFATLGGDDVGDDAKMRVAFHFGLYGSYPLSDKLSLQPELLYSSVGAKYDFSESDPDFGDYSVDGSYQLNYLSVPIMLGFKLSENFSLQVGPQIGFLLSAKDKGDVKFDGGSESYDDDIKDGFKGTDFGLNFGLGYSFGKMGVSARYSLGLSSIADYEDSDLKSNVIQLSLQYKLFGE